MSSVTETAAVRSIYASAQYGNLFPITLAVEMLVGRPALA
jgi:hypothetical protein